MDDARINTEKSILANAIVSWLNHHDGDAGEPVVAAIKRVSIEDAIVLGVDEALWLYMDARQYINPKHKYSDAWFNAVVQAIETFKAQFVLAEVES